MNLEKEEREENCSNSKIILLETEENQLVIILILDVFPNVRDGDGNLVAHNLDFIARR
ncbi:MULTISPECIES: hypothetical protein [unclassified Bacillus (in: firmicutes)]|uniref:hypothetical protein n=1 Tax=unclassified Bacillus (in: firmicutes) TaxID=185979 RepID=UPI001587098D|nr:MULTISPECIES: hypothetical protein [unclassified Bacillus (in: firmicutes)]